MNDLKYYRRSEDTRISRNSLCGWSFAAGMGWMAVLMVVVEGIVK